jgi:hypothetical protein
MSIEGIVFSFSGLYPEPYGAALPGVSFKTIPNNIFLAVGSKIL